MLSIIQNKGAANFQYNWRSQNVGNILTKFSSLENPSIQVFKKFHLSLSYTYRFLSWVACIVNFKKWFFNGKTFYYSCIMYHLELLFSLFTLLLLDCCYQNYIFDFLVLPTLIIVFVIANLKREKAFIGFAIQLHFLKCKETFFTFW